MKRKTLTAILLCVVLTLSCLSLVACNKGGNDEQGEPAAVKELYPTVDFVQPWLLLYSEDADYATMLSGLKNAGYDTVILQYTRTGSTDGTTDSTTMYYPSEIAEKFDGDVSSVDEESDVLGKLLTAADNAEMKVFVGLSTEDAWWNLTKQPTVEWYASRAELDNYMIDEIIENYGTHTSLYGWYWAYETYNSSTSTMKKWADMLNLTLAHLDEIEEKRPLMLSPYITWILRQDADKYLSSWKTFISNVNFRGGDIFAPQDSIGNICHDETANVSALQKTDDVVKMFAESVATKEGLKYWVNCELFYAPNDGSGELYTASLDRCLKQYEIANRYAEKLVTFSYTHYCLPQNSSTRGDEATDFDENYKAYLALRAEGQGTAYAVPAAAEA